MSPAVVDIEHRRTGSSIHSMITEWYAKFNCALTAFVRLVTEETRIKRFSFTCSVVYFGSSEYFFFNIFHRYAVAEVEYFAQSAKH